MINTQQKFKGFIIPKTNYFRLPNDWLDMIRGMPLCEERIILYVLRHTWGYNGQEEKPKRISIDEFMNGRKKKNGDRIDGGLGLSSNSVREGVRLAVEHGYLKVEEKGHDRARIQRFYSLVLTEDTPNFRDSKFEPPSSKIEPRTWKDNKKKENLRKTKKGERSGVPSSTLFKSPGQRSATPGRKKKTNLSGFERKAAAELKTVLVEHEVHRLNKSRIDTLGEQIHRLCESGIEKERIRKVIIWLKTNYGADEYVPVLFKATDVFDKFGKFEHRMKFQNNGANGSKNRITRSNMYDNENCTNGVPRVWVADDGKQYDGVLLNKLRKECRERYGNGLPSKEEIDAVLSMMGEKSGSIPLDVVGRLG